MESIYPFSVTNTPDTNDSRLNEAEMLARKILATQPNNPDALNGLGLIMMEQGSHASAADHFIQALAADPDREDFRSNLRRSLTDAARQSVDAGEYDQAVAYLQRNLEMEPDRVEPLCHLAFTLYSAGRHAEALATADKAVRTDEAHAHAHDVRGLALGGLEKTTGAIASFQKALELDPDFTSAHNNLGTVLLAQKEYRSAIGHFDKVLQIEPGNAMAFNNLGLALAEMAKFVEAEAMLRQAITIAPDFAEAHFNLSRVLLMRGNYVEGWRENEWRWKCREFPSTWRVFPYPVLEDQNVQDKTVLVWSEQGIGDEIMFANPIPDLIAAGATVVMECGERLVGIYERSFERATVVARADPPNPVIEQAGIDYQTPIGSLCKRYRTAKEDFKAADLQYLQADPDCQSELVGRYRRLGKGPLVGICWRSGNPIAGGERSAALELWDGILTQTPCTFISLQYGEVEEDIAGVWDRLGVEVHVDTKVDPFESAEDWFAQVGAMDMVISIDNSTIQVSGSQGVPTWTLLSYLPEWRFGMEGREHDWHQSIRVYRQPTPGDWLTVFDAVSADFADWLGGHSI